MGTPAPEQSGDIPLARERGDRGDIVAVTGTEPWKAPAPWRGAIRSINGFESVLMTGRVCNAAATGPRNSDIGPLDGVSPVINI